MKGVEICRTNINLNQFYQLSASALQNYNKTFATSEDSDQPARPRRQIRVFADQMCLLQPPAYPNGINENP